MTSGTSDSGDMYIGERHVVFFKKPVPVVVHTGSRLLNVNVFIAKMPQLLLGNGFTYEGSE